MTLLGLVTVAALGAAGAAPDTVPLYDDLGSHHHPITTRVEAAQRYFDQGLRLTYAFNHAEAIRAFEQAARLDPECAMCQWGIAYALGPNINAPMDSASGVVAYAAARRALALAPGAAERERAYIEAVSRRYAPGAPSAERAALDSAYARAMGEVADRWPDDLDAAALHAEALMDLSPWNYWRRTGDTYEPRPDTPRILERLEGVLARDPDHPGACHFYIHALEAAHPEKAVDCAERLARQMPGAGHIVHMPGHIYIRVGRWADAVEANRHAVHADESYIADQRPTSLYVAAYYPHNYHFLAFAATMIGRSAEALEAARAVVANTPPEVARDVPELQQLVAYRHLTLVTFGRWRDVLEEPMPPPEVRGATGLAFYARGVALAATGRGEEAAAVRDSVAAIAAEVPEGVSRTALEIAGLALEGEIALRAGRLDEAVDRFREATRREDELPYAEPPHWYYPIRHSLGAALLAAGRAAEAEQAYRADLDRFPENGWALFGLAGSLREQGKEGPAREAEERFRRVWEGADFELEGSRI